MVKRFATSMLVLALAAIAFSACGGSPGAKALADSQKRADEQQAGLDKKAGPGIEAASDTAAGANTTMSTSTGGSMSQSSPASADESALPTSVTMATITKGKGLFTTTCGGCHALKDAGTSGQIGPNLDQLKPGYDHVQMQVKKGGNGMPAGLLSGDDLNAVAGYVATASGAAKAPAA